MRVAVCCAGELYGGVEQFVYLLARHLRTLDHSAAVVILFEDGQLYRKLISAGIETYLVRCCFRYDPAMIGRVSKILSRCRIDVVHTHGYRANVICALAARRLGIPVVKTEHGRIESVLAPRLRSLRARAYLFADRLVTLALVDHIVYVTFDLAASFRRTHRHKESSVIHNGIAPIQHAESGVSGHFESNCFNIGIVGRVSRVKGHMFLLKAVERLSDLTDLRVHLVGSGPLEPELKRYCALHGMDSKVRFYGFREDIHECIRKLDVLVMPSLHEGMPYSALEAMYLRLPIIASAVGGLREVLRDGENAILVPPGNVEKLAAAIRLVRDGPGQRDRIAERAFCDVTSRFMIGDMARRYMDVYGAATARACRTGRKITGRPEDASYQTS